MISYITGEVKHCRPNRLVVLCPSGIGYELNCSQVYQPGRQVSFFISHIIRENAQDLYAFADFELKELFELLLKVKGVGPKSAFSLVSSLGTSNLVMAIQMENINLLKKAPGIGAKAAAQIILDLKEKIKDFVRDQFSKEAESDLRLAGLDGDLNGAVISDAVMAFEELGFSQNIFMPIIQEETKKNPQIATEQLIKNTLQRIG